LKVAERLNVLGSVDFACFKVRNPRTRFLHLLTWYREKFRLSTQLHRYIISKRVHDRHISLVPMEGEEALQTLYEVRRP